MKDDKYYQELLRLEEQAKGAFASNKGRKKPPTDKPKA